jgi:hypothetical protein
MIKTTHSVKVYLNLLLFWAIQQILSGSPHTNVWLFITFEETQKNSNFQRKKYHTRIRIQNLWVNITVPLSWFTFEVRKIFHFDWFSWCSDHFLWFWDKPSRRPHILLLLKSLLTDTRHLLNFIRINHQNCSVYLSFDALTYFFFLLVLFSH